MERLPYPTPSTANASAVMRGNRKVDTRPEVALRSAFHAAGLRFRKNYTIVTRVRSVRVDVAFPRFRLAVFLDGCFWHCCPDHGNTPRANPGYWPAKLRRNVERDHATDLSLAEAGWTVIRVWEHESVAEAVERVGSSLMQI